MAQHEEMLNCAMQLIGAANSAESSPARRAAHAFTIFDAQPLEVQACEPLAAAGRALKDSLLTPAARIDAMNEALEGFVESPAIEPEPVEAPTPATDIQRLLKEFWAIAPHLTFAQCAAAGVSLDFTARLDAVLNGPAQ